MHKWLVIGLCCLLAGCQPNIINRRNVICMIDYSGTIQKETLDIYAKTISESVFMQLAANDKWMLVPIDEGSKIKAEHLLEDDMSQKGFDKGITSVSHRDEEIRKKVEEYQRQNKEAVFNTVKSQKDVRKQYTKFTDILGALDQVSSSLEYDQQASTLSDFWDAVVGNSKTQTENIIIIFSDMIHETEDLNFQRHDLADASINKLIADLRSRKAIPQLKDARVFVCGRTGRDNKVIDGVKQFWTKYFGEAQADLRVYDYDSGSAISSYMRPK